jgi:hypothetical protein
MNDISGKHVTLISSLYKLYNTLTTTRYISAEDVVKPPHTAEVVLNDTFQKLDYGSVTFESIRLMLFLREEVACGWQKNGKAILPRSKAASYAIGRESESTDHRYWGDHSMSSDHQLLPPWMLRFSLANVFRPAWDGSDLYDHDAYVWLFTAMGGGLLTLYRKSRRVESH